MLSTAWNTNTESFKSLRTTVQVKQLPTAQKKRGRAVAWMVKYLPKADKSLRKMDKQTSKLILDRMDEIAALNDPRSRGKAL